MRKIFPDKKYTTKNIHYYKNRNGKMKIMMLLSDDKIQ